MKLTKKQVREDMILMWDWLRKHPEATTKDAFLNTHKDFPTYDNDCPCCEYDDIYGVVECDACPIDWPTTEKLKEDQKIVTCMESFYIKWLITEKEQQDKRKIAATEILKLALTMKTEE